MNKYVKLEEVEKLLEILNERDKYLDYTPNYEECDLKLKVQIKNIRHNAIKIKGIDNMKIKLIMTCPNCSNDEFYETVYDKHICTECEDEYEKYELDLEKVLVQMRPTKEI